MQATLLTIMQPQRYVIMMTGGQLMIRKSYRQRDYLQCLLLARLSCMTVLLK